jgi:hypothetical protein
VVIVCPRCAISELELIGHKNWVSCRLAHDERQSLAAWLNELDYDEWDRQMVANSSPGGSGMELIERDNRNIAQGKPFRSEEGLEQAKAT